jgi:hypothetical protein
MLKPHLTGKNPLDEVFNIWRVVLLVQTLYKISKTLAEYE